MSEFFPESPLTTENKLKDTKEAGVVPTAKAGGNEDDGLEENKKPDDEFASPEDVDMLKMDISNEIKARARILGITEEALKDYLSLDIDNLEADNLTNHELEITRENLESAVRGFWKLYRDKKECLPYSVTFFDTIKEVVKRKVIPMGMLTVYLSSFGSAFLKELAGSEVKMEYGGKDIAIKDLVKDKELMDNIDRNHASGDPLDIAIFFTPSEKFKGEDTEGQEVEFSLVARDKIVGENKVEKMININDESAQSEDIQKLNDDLLNLGVAAGFNEEGCPWELFESQKEEIIDIFAKDLKIPREKVAQYIDNFLHPKEYKDVKVVGLNQFKVDSNPDIEKDAHKLSNKYSEILAKHNIGVDSPPEDVFKAKDEFSSWGEANSYPDVFKALNEEAEKYNNSPQKKLKSLEEESSKKLEEEEDYYERLSSGKKDPEKWSVEKDKNDALFEEELLLALKEKGYDLPKLREMGNKNPEKVMMILSETIGEKVHYDWSEFLLTEYYIFVVKLLGKDWLGLYNSLGDKHSKGIPFATLDSGSGVCHDYSMTLIAAKKVMEKENVPNMDKFVITFAISDKQMHEFNAVATVDAKGNVVVTYVDAAWFSSILKPLRPLNAANDYFGSKINMDDETMKKQEELKMRNIILLQEELKRILSQERVMEEISNEELTGEKEAEAEEENMGRDKSSSENKVENLLAGVREKIFRHRREE